MSNLIGYSPAAKQRFWSKALTLGGVRAAIGLLVACIAMAGGADRAQARDGDALEPPEAFGADQSAVRAVIEGQLEAFRNEDLALALSFADFSIQAMVGDPEAFGALVRNGYAPIYFNVDHAFGDFAQNGPAAIQELEVTGQDGTRAVAQYRMTNASGSWRIAGVIMRPVPDG